MRQDALWSRGSLLLCAHDWHIVSAQTSLDEQALSRSLIPWSSLSGLIRGSETPNGYGTKATHWGLPHGMGVRPTSWVKDQTVCNSQQRTLERERGHFFSLAKTKPPDPLPGGSYCKELAELQSPFRSQCPRNRCERHCASYSQARWQL